MEPIHEEQGVQLAFSPHDATSQEQSGLMPQSELLAPEPNKPSPPRDSWSNQMDFLFSCLGYAVGLGNVWRFPYLCFVNGGGAFLIPYFLSLLLCGLPLFLLELGVGQFGSQGPATCWRMAPALKGIGYCTFLFASIGTTYYNVIIGYSLYYLVASFTVPWYGCDNWWNTELCSQTKPNCTITDEMQLDNGTCTNITRLPADEYLNNAVLKSSANIGDFGLPDPLLSLSLLCTTLLMLLCMARGIKSSGKIVYFTALFPYIVLLALFCYGIQLSGAWQGIHFYLNPNFHRLADPKVWRDAAGQILFSFSIGGGGLISLSSYNSFSNNILRDTLIVCLANCATSVFAGFVIFCFIGHFAHVIGVLVPEVTESGIGLAFIIYPEALKILPGAAVWSFLFFAMLIFLGLDSTFATVEAVTTSLYDLKPHLRQRKLMTISCVSAILFTIGLLYTCRGGVHLIKIIDSYIGWLLLINVLFECICIGWVYGSFERDDAHDDAAANAAAGPAVTFSNDLSFMLGFQLWPLWHLMWRFISPATVLFILVSNIVLYKRTRYGDGRQMPLWADAIGWVIVFSSLLLLLLSALHEVWLRVESGATWRQGVVSALSPIASWGPVKAGDRQRWQLRRKRAALQTEVQTEFYD